VHGTRRITPETGIRLSRALGLSDAYWVTMQMDYDLEVEKEKHRDVLDAIERLSA
jgi:addiction module HigA family antidote